MQKQFDVAVIGAGAAGMMCAAIAGQHGKKVVLIDHAHKLAEKIRISGGGRCNFTNLDTGPQHFLSQNPHFCKSALSRFTPQDFLRLVKQYRIGYHEKHKGQLFCDDSSEQIIGMLKAECVLGNVQWRMPCKIIDIAKKDQLFHIHSAAGEILAANLVIATGGLSIPKIGATDFAYRIARQFDLAIVEPRPGLVPLTFDSTAWLPFLSLAGIALPVSIETQQAKFHEDLLFTHRGLSGPAILQISSFWEKNTVLHVNLLPEMKLTQALIEEKNRNRKNTGNILAQWLPARLASSIAEIHQIDPAIGLANVPDRVLKNLSDFINCWTIQPNGSEGYRKAEVTIGGVDTQELSQQTMMSTRVAGLYFIGEAVDVTGWLGGYNFQWAWASGVAAGRALV